jgi:hypothetical protein
MQYVRPVDMSNTLVHMPVRAQNMLVNGYLVQSVAQFNFDPSNVRVEINDVYHYDPSSNGLDPYWLDPSGVFNSSGVMVQERRIDQAYKDRTKDMKVHPMFHSGGYGINKYRIY